MKANAPRRQIFTDAVDLLTGGNEVFTVTENSVQMLEIDSIQAFHNHPFRLYSGERLDDMVESIKAHGILTPAIVRKTEKGFEMLAGHNRMNAGKLAGLKTIPCIVKENLTDHDAYVYVIETNLMQRSFNDMLPSEQAAVLAERYEKVSNQGRRNDIIKELEALSNQRIEQTSGQIGQKSIRQTSGQIGQKLTGREAVGKEYGLSSRVVARFLRLNHLIQPFKLMVDDAILPQNAAVELSFLSAPAQGWVYDAVKEVGLRLNIKVANLFRAEADTLTEKRVLEITKDVIESTQSAPAFQRVKLATDTYQKYFEGFKAEQVTDIIEKALAIYFSQNQTEVV